MVSDDNRNEYQPWARAWDPLRPDIEKLLADADHRAIRPMYVGSNYCFLVTLSHRAAGQSYAVYKPRSGEYPLYDFPQGTLYKREIASYLVDVLLRWSLVPPTVVSRGEYGMGSLQLFIEAGEASEVVLDDLRRLALLDMLLNNADRKSEHCLVAPGGKIWAIDHGLTFHVHPKLRTILWHFSGTVIPPAERRDLQRMSAELEAGSGVTAQLRDLLSPVEWLALIERGKRLSSRVRFPDPPYKPVPYRW